MTPNELREIEARVKGLEAKSSEYYREGQSNGFVVGYEIAWQDRLNGHPKDAELARRIYDGEVLP